MKLPRSYVNGPVAWCRECRKDSYASRKCARYQLRKTPDAKRMREYQCPADDRHWHLGRLPQAVIHGLMSAAEVYGEAS